MAVVADAEIKKWNKIYRGKKSPTDVLSFVAKEGKRIPGANDYLGEIIINWPQTVRQARVDGWPAKNEFTLLLVHGLLHLLGYDHETDASRARKMAVAEKKILAKLGIKRQKRV